jgi:hypothetical protein
MGGGPLPPTEPDDSLAPLQYGSNSPPVPVELEVGKSDLSVNFSVENDVSFKRSRLLDILSMI